MSAQAALDAGPAIAGPVLALLAVLVTVVFVRLGARRRRQAHDARHALARTALDAALVLSVLLVLVATLLPFSWGGVAARDSFGQAAVNLVPLHTISDMLRFGSADQQWANLAVNVLLFVPLGWTLALKARRLAPVTMAVLGGAMVSAGVELGQYVLPLSRSTDVDDLLLNTLGALLGGLIAVVVLPALRWAAHSRGPRDRSRETVAA